METTLPHKEALPTRKHRTRHVIIGLALIIALGLLGGRIYLPYWLTDYVNEQIAGLDGYGGAITDIDVHLWRGAYQIQGMNIYKTNGYKNTPFVAADTIDLGLEWRALLRGKIVAELDLYGIDLNFSKVQTGEGAGWASFVDALSPFDINRLDVHSGKIAYVDYTAQPNVNVYITDIAASVTNLRNVDDINARLPSSLSLSGRSIGAGDLRISGQMNILKDIPDFDIEAQLENAALSSLNDYTRAAAAIDFETGDISIYAELAAADGRLTGYVKPIATNVSLVDTANSDPVTLLWESLVSVFMEIFENQPTDQFAMNIPIEGDLNNPSRNMWQAFLSIFRNAFGQAFTRDTEGNIDFEDALERSAVPPQS